MDSCYRDYGPLIWSCAATTPLPRLRAALVTPQQDFFVRGHGNIPLLDGAKHRLRARSNSGTIIVISI
jgi:hypothetical protein